MSTPSGSRGGAIAIRGFVVQTLVALLDVAKPGSTFSEITLEPLQAGNDKFDYLWKDSSGAHAVQVKSTEGAFMPTEVNTWAADTKLHN